MPVVHRRQPHRVGEAAALAPRQHAVRHRRVRRPEVVGRVAAMSRPVCAASSASPASCRSCPGRCRGRASCSAWRARDRHSLRAPRARYRPPSRRCAGRQRRGGRRGATAAAMRCRGLLPRCRRRPSGAGCRASPAPKPHSAAARAPARPLRRGRRPARSCRAPRRRIRPPHRIPAGRRPRAVRRSAAGRCACANRCTVGFQPPDTASRSQSSAMPPASRARYRARPAAARRIPAHPPGASTCPAVATTACPE